MKKGELILTLCYQCKQIIGESNALKKLSSIKEPCDICKRFGYTYEVKKRTTRGGEVWQMKKI